MNPFEWCQSFIGKWFPKRIGTITPFNPKIFRRGTMCPLLVFRYAQIGRANRVKTATSLLRLDKHQASHIKVISKVHSSLLPEEPNFCWGPPRMWDRMPLWCDMCQVGTAHKLLSSLSTGAVNCFELMRMSTKKEALWNIPLLAQGRRKNFFSPK